MSKANPNEVTIHGSVVYHAGYFSEEEKDAGLTITFWLDEDILSGTIHFAGHETWNANIPQTRVTTYFPDFPSPMVLQERAREVLIAYMEARWYVHREIKLGTPR